METTGYHIPALLTETIKSLNINPSGVYADATFGGGGHSRAILENLNNNGHLYGFDRDLDALANAPKGDKRFTFVHSDFRFIQNFLRYYGEEKIDGLLADLGVSSHHFDDPSRGFTFRQDAPLDMRMNQNSGKSAADIINEYSQEDLTKLFRLYGELSKGHKIAEAICKARATEPILTTSRLLEVTKNMIDPRKEKKELAQLFQAIRIEVNNELDSLTHLLNSAEMILKPGGRLAIITYHSLEDRLVKNFIKSGNTEGNIEKDFFGRVNSPWRQIGKGLIIPTEEEIEKNPRARSAKLRIAERAETSND